MDNLCVNKYGDGVDKQAELMLVSMLLNGGITTYPRITRDDLFFDTAQRLYDIAMSEIPTPNIADAQRFGIDINQWLNVLELSSGSANISFWADKVRRNAAIRRSIDALTEQLSTLKSANTADENDLNILLSIDDCASSTPRTWGELSNEAREVHDKMKVGFVVPEELKNLSYFVRDFSPGDQLIIAAASGVGKTSLGIEIAKHYKTLFISGEMGAYSLASRFHAQTYFKYCDSFGLKGNEFEQIKSFNEMFTGKDLETLGHDGWKYITEACSLNKIAIEFSRAKQNGFECVLIDYLQLMSNSQSKDRRNEIGSIARGTKQLAQKFGLRSILLCQVRRPRDSADGTDPRTVMVTTDRLKEAGDIEESANIIMGAWLDKKDTSIMLVKDIKHRNAKTHPCTQLKCLGPYIRDYKESDFTIEEEEDHKPMIEKEDKKWSY